MFLSIFTVFLESIWDDWKGDPSEVVGMAVNNNIYIVDLMSLKFNEELNDQVIIGKSFLYAENIRKRRYGTNETKATLHPPVKTRGLHKSFNKGGSHSLWRALQCPAKQTCIHKIITINQNATITTKT